MAGPAVVENRARVPVNRLHLLRNNARFHPDLFQSRFSLADQLTSSGICPAFDGADEGHVQTSIVKRPSLGAGGHSEWKTLNPSIEPECQMPTVGEKHQIGVVAVGEPEVALKVVFA